MLKDIILKLKETLPVKNLRKHLSVLEKDCKGLGISVYSLHELIRNYAAKNTTHTLEDKDKTGFVEIIPDCRIIGDCRICEIEQEKDILEKNTVNQINQIKKFTLDINQIKIKIQKQKNWGSVILALVLFTIVICFIITVNTVSNNKFEKSINENNIKINSLKQQNKDLEFQKTSLTLSNDSINKQEKKIRYQEATLSKRKDSLVAQKNELYSKVSD